MRWQREKIRHYRELLSSISALAIDNDSEEALRRFAEAVNTVALVAPRAVVDALMAFHDALSSSNPNRQPERHDELLNAMILEIRRDLSLVKRSDQQPLAFHLIGAKPRRPRRPEPTAALKQ